MTLKPILISICAACLVTLGSCAQRHEPKTTQSDSASSTHASQAIDSPVRVKEVPPTEFRVLATVKAINQADSTLTIDHEAMEGFSGAMTMLYKVGDPAILKRVQVGTFGHFTIVVTNGKGVITAVHVHHK